MSQPKAELGWHSFPKGDQRAVLGVWTGAKEFATMARTTILIGMTILSHLFNPQNLLLFL